MDIGAVSVSLAQSRTESAADISVLKMANEQSVDQAQQLVQMMERSAQPNLGGKLDIRV